MENLPETQTNNEKPKSGLNKTFRILWRVFKYCFLVFIVLFLGVITLGWIYGDKIKQYAVDELNKNLNTQVFVNPDDIDFTIIKNFPLAAVEFKNIKALEALDYKKKDTLLNAKLVSFQFNVWDIFNENYTIKKLQIQDAAVNLKILKSGKNNYEFLKADTTTSKDSTKFSFALDEINLFNTTVLYNDYKNDVSIAGNLIESNLSLLINGSSYNIDVVSSVFVNKLKADSTNYLSEKKVTTSFKLNVDDENDVYTFKNIYTSIEKLNLHTSGEIVISEKGTDFELAIEGKDLSIQSVLSLLPAKYKTDIADYYSEGNFYLKSDIKGLLSEKTEPIFSCKFGITNGNISHTKTAVNLSDLNLTGTYSTQSVKEKLPELVIKEISATLGKGKINGAFSITGNNNPYLSAKAKGEISLTDLKQLLQIDTIETITGDLKIDAIYNGNIKALKKYVESDLSNNQTSGEMSLNNVAIKWKKNPIEWTNINGDFYFKNNDIGINSFTGNISNSDFELKGIFKNALAYALTSNSALLVNAELNSKKIDLNELLADKTNSGSSAYTLALPENIDFNLNCNIAEIVFRKFNATNISGAFKMKDKKIIADPLQFKTMRGGIKTSLMIDATNAEKILITCDASITNLDVNKIFYSFENFGQSYLEEKHIRGVANANIQFASMWSNNLEIDMDKIYALCDVTIEQGELISFSPFIEIADDMKKDVLMRQFIEVDEFSKKMQHIKFSSLKNQIEIKKQKITFSPMLIKSSALNIDFSGWHNFKNDIDYHFSFLLSEVFTKGEKKRMEQNKEFGEEENDGTGKILYYTMTGTVDNPIFKKDYKTQKEKRKEDVKKEKQNLKQILKDEFGWFKKDTTLKNSKNEKPDSKSPNGNKFILNWDEKDESKKEEDF